MGKRARAQTPAERIARREELRRARRRSESETRAALERENEAHTVEGARAITHGIPRRARTLTWLNTTNRIESLLLSVNDQLRRVGDAVLSLDDACDDAFGVFEGAVDETLRKAVRDKRSTTEQTMEFLRTYLIALLKRTVVVFDGGERVSNGAGRGVEYALAAETTPRHVFRGENESTSFASALFVHVNRDGRFRSIVLDADANDSNYNAPFLYRGGDVKGDGEGVMNTVFDAVNRQLKRAELAHETRDAEAWRQVVLEHMREEPRDQLLNRTAN